MLSITNRQRRIVPFRDGEIGRAELEGEETRLHRAAVLVSHSVDVATPNYPILYPPPRVSKLHSPILQSRLSSKNVHSTPANVPNERFAPFLLFRIIAYNPVPIFSLG